MNIFIDPAYKAYYENRLFDEEDKILNRDDTLAPFIRMKTFLNAQNKVVQTADYLHQSTDSNIEGEYYSFGLLECLDALLLKKNIRLKAFVISEPPVVAPELYQALPKLTQLFERVYVHNVVGDGYSLCGVSTYKLRKWYWPQPHQDVIAHYWNNERRQRRIVVINGNHKPRSFQSELYSKRIRVMVALAQFNIVDLYGRGWDKWYSRASLWRPYWLNIVDLYGRGWDNWYSRASLWRPYWFNRRKLMSIYKGSCESKLDVLSQYDFCLCFENMQMQGYVTEKLFDCLYAGTIPIYLGAHDISDLIPSRAYIDFREYLSIEDLYHYLINMTPSDVSKYKQAGRDFLQSQEGVNYYHALNHLMAEQS